MGTTEILLGVIIAFYYAHSVVGVSLDQARTADAKVLSKVYASRSRPILICLGRYRYR